MHRFANPRQFLRIANPLLPWIAGGAMLLLAVGLYLGLLASPPDYQQGETVRIMYVHVPSAWMSVFVYTSMAIASATSLIWRHPLADVVARNSASLGAGFTLITLITGALWGKPMWGTWWVWDARLTSVLILFFLYLGYMVLVDAFDNPERGARAAAILCLVGFVNVPIIKFSVEWWNTLHQPASVFRMDGPAIDASMLWPLLCMAGAFTLIYLALLIVRIKASVLGHKIRRLQMPQ